MRIRQLCGAKTRRGTSCIRKARSNGRCPNHGGCSTGPRTPEGKAKIAAVQRDRWARWREEQPQLSDTAAAWVHHGVLEFSDARDGKVLVRPDSKIVARSAPDLGDITHVRARHGVQPDYPKVTLRSDPTITPSQPRQPDLSPVTTRADLIGVTTRGERWVRPQVQVGYAGKKRR